MISCMLSTFLFIVFVDCSEASRSFGEKLFILPFYSTLVMHGTTHANFLALYEQNSIDLYYLLPPQLRPAISHLPSMRPHAGSSSSAPPREARFRVLHHSPRGTLGDGIPSPYLPSTGTGEEVEYPQPESTRSGSFPRELSGVPEPYRSDAILYEGRELSYECGHDLKRRRLLTLGGSDFSSSSGSDDDGTVGSSEDESEDSSGSSSSSGSDSEDDSSPSSSPSDGFLCFERLQMDDRLEPDDRPYFNRADQHWQDGTGQGLIGPYPTNGHAPGRPEMVGPGHLRRSDLRRGEPQASTSGDPDPSRRLGGNQERPRPLLPGPPDSWPEGYIY